MHRESEVAAHTAEVDSVVPVFGLDILHGQFGSRDLCGDQTPDTKGQMHGDHGESGEATPPGLLPEIRESP
jgi:hypothetical protein